MNQTIIGTADRMDGSIGIVEISCKQQLDAFIANIDTDLEDRRKDLIRAEALAAEKKALCAAFPETLPQAPYRLAIGSNVYKGDAELGFEVTSYDDVVRLVDALPGVPVVIVAAGCTTFIPEERYVKKEGQNDKVTPIGDVVYRLLNWVSERQEEYTWWTRLAGKLVHVVAKTKKGCAINAQVRSTSKSLDLQGKFHEVTWTYSNLPNGEVMQWSGGRTPGEVIPVSVHQARGVSFSDAVAKPMSTSCKINTQRCDC